MGTIRYNLFGRTHGPINVIASTHLHFVYIYYKSNNTTNIQLCNKNGDFIVYWVFIEDALLCLSNKHQFLANWLEHSKIMLPELRHNHQHSFEYCPWDAKQLEPVWLPLPGLAIIIQFDAHRSSQVCRSWWSSSELTLKLISNGQSLGNCNCTSRTPQTFPRMDKYAFNRSFCVVSQRVTWRRDHD